MIQEELASDLADIAKLPPDMIVEVLVKMLNHSPALGVVACQTLSSSVMQKYPELSQAYREALRQTKQKATKKGARNAAEAVEAETLNDTGPTAGCSTGCQAGGGSAAHLVEVDPLSLMPADLADAERMLREVVDPKGEEPPIYHDLVRLMRSLAALHGEGHMRDFGFPQLVRDLVGLFRRRGLDDGAAAEQLRQSFEWLLLWQATEKLSTDLPGSKSDDKRCSPDPMAVDLGNQPRTNRLITLPLGSPIDPSSISLFSVVSQQRAFAAMPPHVEFFLTTPELDQRSSKFILLLIRARILAEPTSSDGSYKISYRRVNDAHTKTGWFGGPNELVVAVTRVKGDDFAARHHRTRRARATVESAKTYRTALAVPDATSTRGGDARRVRLGLDEVRWETTSASELLRTLIERQRAARVRLITAAQLPEPAAFAEHVHQWATANCKDTTFGSDIFFLIIDVFVEIEKQARSRRHTVSGWRCLFDDVARVTADALMGLGQSSKGKRSSVIQRAVKMIEGTPAVEEPLSHRCGTAQESVTCIVGVATLSLEWLVPMPDCSETLFKHNNLQPGQVAATYWIALVMSQWRRRAEDRFCAWCCWPAVRRCGGCRRAAYCSRWCQKSHWNHGHSLNCKQPAPLGDVPTVGDVSAAEQCNAAGHKLYADGKPSEAAAQYAAATRLAPRAAKYYGNLAQARLDVGDLTGAEEAARAALVRLDADEASGAQAQTTADPASHTQRAKWGLRLAIALERQGRPEAALTALTEPRVFRAAMAQGELMADEVLRMRARCERALLPTRSQLEALKSGSSQRQTVSAADVDDHRAWDVLVRVVVGHFPQTLSVLAKMRVLLAGLLASRDDVRLPKGLTSAALHMRQVNSTLDTLTDVYVPAITACRNDADASKLIAQAQLLLEAAHAPMAAVAVSMLSDVGPSRHLGIHGVALKNDDERHWDARTTPKVLPTDAWPRVAPAMALRTARAVVIASLSEAAQRQTALMPLLQACAPNIDRRVREMFAFARSETTHMGGAAHPDMSQHFLAESGDYPTFGAVMWRILQGCRLFETRFNLPDPYLPNKQLAKDLGGLGVPRECAAIAMGMCASDHIGYNCDDGKFREQLMTTVWTSLISDCCVKGDPEMISARGEDAGKRLSLLAMPLEWEESSKWPMVRRYLHGAFPGR